MKLSHYVVKTKHLDEPVLFNTVTKLMLAASASQELLSKHFFLEGQESLALDAALFNQSDKLCINVNPTWECTLRCKHCSVLTQLVAKQKHKLDVKGLVSFVRKALTHSKYTHLLYCFAGGEPLIEAETINTLIEETNTLIKEMFPHVIFNNTITTNATLPLDETRQKTLHLMKQVTVSVDGNEKEHNEQRHAYKAKFNPFQTTLANIRTMLDIGLFEKLDVQASLADDILTKEYAGEFMRTFLRMGISNIKIGSIHPTNVYKKPTENYFTDLKNAHVRPIPCCKFRYGAVYSTDASGKIYDAVWEWSRNELGTIYDDPETIYRNQINNIRNQFPCFKDKNCLSCPAIGLCWGGCTNGTTVVGDNPSSYCNQKRMLNVISNFAENNTITSLSGCTIKKAE